MNVLKKIILPLVLILLVGGLISWKLSSNKQKMEEKAAVGNQKTVVFPVTTIKPTHQSMIKGFSANGVFNPSHTLNFLSELSGRVLSHNISTGQYITKGHVVAQLDNAQILIDLTLANQSLDKARADLAKYESMLHNNAATQQQVADQRMGINNAESRIATLKRQLSTTTIIAPISGIVNKSYLETGSYLSPGANIAEIIDISTLKMQAMVLDRDMIHLSLGKTVPITPDLYPDAPIFGKITNIAAKADASRNFAIEITVQNPSKNKLRAGMTGSAKFDIGGTTTARVIPTKCIVGSLQSPQVYIVNNGVVSLKSITT
ncbi:MAG: hypothetical protein RLZZ292_3624, partial [Bacteroidota bacterium]